MITTNTPQVREFDERFCWRIEHDEVAAHNALVAALRRAATEPGALSTARSASERYIREVASHERIAKAYEAVISGCLASSPTSNLVDGETTDPLKYTNPLRHVEGVNCVGDITAAVGLGIEAHQMMRTILREGIPASFVENSMPSPVRDETALDLVHGLPTTPRYPTSIVFRNIDSFSSVPDDVLQESTDGTYRISRWFWEMQEFPDEFLRQFTRIDEVWVSSKFNQAAMGLVTAKPISVIPAMVEVPVSVNVTPTQFGLPDDRFIFLFGFDASQFQSARTHLDSSKHSSRHLASQGEKARRFLWSRRTIWSETSMRSDCSAAICRER